MRIAIAAVAMSIAHLSLTQFAHLYDGNSYLITARFFAGETAEFNDYHGRVFFGLPMTLAALARLGIPMAPAALVLNGSTAALAAVFAARLFRDLRVGYACAVLFPHTLMNSCLTMTESPMLALSLAAMVLVRDSTGRARPVRLVAAGLLLGMAMLFRPMACFGLIGLAAAELLARRWKNVLAIGIAAVVVCIGGILLQGHWRGDMLANFRYQAVSPNAYGGRLLSIPFRAILLSPFERQIGAGRVVYLWLHAAVVFLACGLTVRQLLRRVNHAISSDTTEAVSPRWLMTLAAVWLGGNTLFLVSLGSEWGFECFHRFSIPAAPAMWWILRKGLPRSRWVWVAVAIVSGVIAAMTILSDQRGMG